MQFSKVLFAAAAFAVSQVAAVIFTDPSFGGIAVGSGFNITWSGASGAVTITLKNGNPGALKTVSVLGSGLVGGSYIWFPDASLATGTYALQIDDSTGTPNYSVQFPLTGGVASVSSAASSASSASVSSLASSASSVLSSITGNSTSSAFSAATTTTSTGATTSKSTSSKTSSSSAGTSSSTTAPSSAAGLSSPIALIFLAFAAFLTLN